VIATQSHYEQLKKTVLQRLKWAAGANPSLAQTLVQFEDALAVDQAVLEVGDQYCHCLFLHTWLIETIYLTIIDHCSRLYSECFRQIVSAGSYARQDNTLSFNQHVNNIVKNCDYHLQALRHIRSLVTDEVAKMMACSVIGSRIYNCNSLFYGMTDRTLNKLQCVQNRAARIVCSTQLLHIYFVTCIGYQCAPVSSLNCQHCVFDHEH